MISTETKTDELLTVNEVARTLRVDTTTVRRWISAGVLDAIALPNAGVYRQYRVKASVLAKILGGK